MQNNLEAFLQEAAQRFASEARQAAAAEQGADRPRPSRQQERQMLTDADDYDEAEVVESSHQAFQAQTSIFGGPGQLSSGSETKHQYYETDPIAEIFRDPLALRKAFIASQIFDRKF